MLYSVFQEQAHRKWVRVVKTAHPLPNAEKHYKSLLEAAKKEKLTFRLLPAGPKDRIGKIKM